MKIERRIGIANTDDANLVDKIILLRCAFKVSTTLCMRNAYTQNLMRLIYVQHFRFCCRWVGPSLTCYPTKSHQTTLGIDIDNEADRCCKRYHT